MLVLCRKIGEEIVIGDGIVLVVKRIAGPRVTLGIKAPEGVRILRGELKPLDRGPGPQGPSPLVEPAQPLSTGAPPSKPR